MLEKNVVFVKHRETGERYFNICLYSIVCSLVNENGSHLECLLVWRESLRKQVLTNAIDGTWPTTPAARSSPLKCTKAAIGTLAATGDSKSITRRVPDGVSWYFSYRHPLRVAACSGYDSTILRVSRKSKLPRSRNRARHRPPLVSSAGADWFAAVREGRSEKENGKGA